MTPKQWRNGGFKEYSKNILRIYNKKTFDITPEIVKMPELKGYYIRHTATTDP